MDTIAAAVAKNVSSPSYHVLSHVASTPSPPVGIPYFDDMVKDVEEDPQLAEYGQW
jgi:hypothetical protein